MRSIPCSSLAFSTAWLAATIWTVFSDRWLKHKGITFEEKSLARVRIQLTFNQIALEEAGRYAAEDADVTLQLHLKMWPKLQQHEGPLNIFPAH